MTDMNLQEMHDKLLAEKPEGANHEEQNCPLCAGGIDEPEGGSVSDTKTYTEEELSAKVAEATTELASKLAELESRMAESAYQEQLAQVQATLDATVLELEQVKADKAAVETAKAEVEQFWADAIAQKEADDAAVARRDERIEAIKAAASFPEEYLAANADRYAAMSDEDFAARIEEWKTIAPRSATEEVVPAVTAMTASAETTGRSSAVRHLAELRKAGVDPRSLIN